MTYRAWSSALLVIVLAACGGGGRSGIPPVSSNQPIPSATAAPAKKGTAATLTVIVPHPSSTSAVRRPAYVSPSSAQLVVSVNSGTPASYGLTSTSPGCTVVQGNTQCLLQVPAAAGNDSFTLTIEDGLGNVLSKNIVNATIAAGQSTPVNVTLAGIPASVAIVPGSGSTMEDSANPAWHVPGLLPQHVEVEALDADGNVIIGQGAPVIGTPAVTTGGSYATIVSAQTTDPNAYLLKATSGKAGGQTVTVSASAQSIKLSDGSQSAPVSGGTNFLYTPAVVIAGSEIGGLYSVETTNLLAQFSVCGGGCAGLTLASNVATDSNGDMFVETFSSLGLSQSYTVYVFPAGSLSPSNVYGGSNGVTGAGGIAVDSNRTLYVTNAEAFVGSFPHRTEVPAALNAFTWGATAPTTALTDSTETYLTGPISTAIDKNGRLYVLNQDDTIDIYPAGANSIVPTTIVDATSVSEPSGIAVDANGGIYVFDQGNSDIAYFAAGATSVTNTISDSSFYNASGALWFDGNGNLNVSLSGGNDTEILAGSALPGGQVTYLGYYPSEGFGAWIP